LEGAVVSLETWTRDVILGNETKDPAYAPYCLRCTGLVRMRKVELHYWRCFCGAQCDYRKENIDETTADVSRILHTVSSKKETP
jgi:hypothetical protein